MIKIVLLCVLIAAVITLIKKSIKVAMLLLIIGAAVAALIQSGVLN